MALSSSMVMLAYTWTSVPALATLGIMFSKASKFMAPLTSMLHRILVGMSWQQGRSEQAHEPRSEHGLPSG